MCISPSAYIYTRAEATNQFFSLSSSRQGKLSHQTLASMFTKRNFLSAETKKEDKENKCPVCLDIFRNPRTLKKCKHKFCKSCIDRVLKVKNQCPFCKTPCGAPRKGNQPPGSMSSTSSSRIQLPGFEGRGAIILKYDFPAGTQAAGHPNPGSPYPGTTRTAYLPDNAAGKEVLKLLERAFDARLIFTVGTSMTSGSPNQIIWDGIAHKTSITGGPMKYVIFLC